LKDDKWAQFLIEELGLPKDSSPDENAAEIAHRVSLMSPYDFELLQNRLKLRTQQDQEANSLAKFKQLNRHHFDQKDQELRVNQSPRSNQLDVNILVLSNLTFDFRMLT
jgi:hypothetical protein